MATSKLYLQLRREKQIENIALKMIGEEWFSLQLTKNKNNFHFQCHIRQPHDDDNNNLSSVCGIKFGFLAQFFTSSPFFF